MRKLLSLLIVLASYYYVNAQGQTAVLDTFKAQIARATTTEEKFEYTGRLSMVLMNTDPAEADRYGQQLIEMAEMSRDRRLMIKAQLINGERYSYLAGRKENATKAINFYNKGLELAKTNKIDDLTVSAYLYLSEVHRSMVETEKALTYCNQAYSYAGTIKNDSLTAKVHLEYGMVYMQKNEKLLSLRNLMAGLRIAEDLNNLYLLRFGYSRLAQFYTVIEDYDKAIDYQVKAMDATIRINNAQSPYNRIQDLNKIGDLHGSKGNYDMAKVYYEKALALADSVKYEPIKAMSYRSIIDNYIRSDEVQKALDYFNQHPQLANFMQKIGFGYFIDQTYGYIYAQLGNYDSAKYFYAKAAPFFANDANIGNKYSYLYQLGMVHKKTRELDKSIDYFLQANAIAERTGNLQILSNTATMLDTVYQLKGDYKQAIYYSTLNSKYKDSLQKLGKEKDLMQVEAADEQQRQERIAREKEEKKRKRDSIQYLGITIGIVLLFIILVMMGMFRVSVNTIKAIGFFVFLLLFEFVFLIFKKNIYAITHGEPWKDLMFMIALAALLLPLHHWLEHRVIKYLTSHNRLTAAGHHIKKKLFGRAGQDEQ